MQRGETLSSIARQYGVSMEAIRTLNKLKKEGVWVVQRLRRRSVRVGTKWRVAIH